MIGYLGVGGHIWIKPSEDNSLLPRDHRDLVVQCEKLYALLSTTTQILLILSYLNSSF